MEAEFRVNVAGGVAAVRQAETDRRLRRAGGTSPLTMGTGFDPILHCLRHSDPIIHQLEKEEESNLFFLHHRDLNVFILMNHFENGENYSHVKHLSFDFLVSHNSDLFLIVFFLLRI